MKIVLSAEALSWFKAEMAAESGDSIKFFARYGGASPLHDGFSLGVRMESPDEAAVQTEHDGVQYYIERRDEWYFLEHDLHVNVDPKLDELIYSYKKA
ncbi:HesB/YadR/YfhF family protein [Sporosarcina beigongshangi]|uniref:HesB/YadR/YfhF family protein n=1 Tax=Sporosarcina beigongshangi TaxID=2782538 RepID=UPI00193ABA85|nr:HesB/YadR/YfhF family protein [Sporosarcina beigongshangi]